MPLGAALLLLLLRAARGCWSGGLTPELCCDLGASPRGNPVCWDDEYTFERCCGKRGAPPQASQEVGALKIDPAVIPQLPLHGGGKMPIVGIGLCCRPTAQGDAARQAVVDFLMMGGRHLDDATLYTNHREVGEGLRQAVDLGVPRSEIFLTTKIWPSDYGFEEATKWLERIMDELGVDYIDLVLLHKPGLESQLPCGSHRACRQETWMALQRARSAGKIRHLGVSNFGKRQMEEILALGGAPITANQFEYHPWVPQVHRDTAEWCHQHGIAVTAYGSMGSNSMKDQVLTQDALKQIGGNHGKTAGQVLLRWAVERNVSVIPGTSNPRHMAENLRIFDFELSPEERGLLDSVPAEPGRLFFGHTPDESP